MKVIVLSNEYIFSRIAVKLQWGGGVEIILFHEIHQLLSHQPTSINTWERSNTFTRAVSNRQAHMQDSNSSINGARNQSNPSNRRTLPNCLQLPQEQSSRHSSFTLANTATLPNFASFRIPGSGRTFHFRR